MPLQVYNSFCSNANYNLYKWLVTHNIAALSIMNYSVSQISFDLCKGRHINRKLYDPLYNIIDIFINNLYSLYVVNYIIIFITIR